jgi:hypothetical protein
VKNFPRRPRHRVPHWAADDAIFHIRIGLDRQYRQPRLTSSDVATALLTSARRYEEKRRWFITISS